MRIFIDEEYGWRYWSWAYPGTAAELRADWEAGRIPPGIGYVAATPSFRGMVTEIEPLAPYWARLEQESVGLSDDQIMAAIDAKGSKMMNEIGEEWDKFLSAYDAQADIHEEDDSSLQIGDLILPWPFARNDEAMVEERRANPLPKEQP